MSNATVHPAHASVSLPSRARQFYALTKPRVVQLIVFCAVIGMLLATPGLPDWQVALAATVGIWLVAGAAAAFNCLVEQHIDARMARTAWRPTATRRADERQTLDVLGAALRGRQRAALFRGQPADDVADVRDLRRLRGHLHRGAEAADAAEHRDRRRLGRDAAGARLGRDPRRGRPRGADPVPDHLPVDAAALLGAGALPRRGLPQVRPADAAGHARLRVHAAARAALHAGAVRRRRCCRSSPA